MANIIGSSGPRLEVSGPWCSAQRVSSLRFNIMRDFDPLRASQAPLHHRTPYPGNGLELAS